MSTGAFFEDDLAILAEFVDESESDLNKVGNHFVALEAKPGDMELINTIFRPIHSIKGNSAFLGLMRVRTLAHEMETMLDDFRKQRSTPSPPTISMLLRGVDELSAILKRIRKQEPEITDETAFNALLAEIQANQADASPQSDTPPPEQQSADAATAAAPTKKDEEPAAQSKTEIGRTMRIPEKFIDDLRNLHAELRKLQQKLTAPDVSDHQTLLREAAASLTRLADAMDVKITDVSSVPAGELMQRAPRIARETAALTGKSVGVKTTGGNLRISKSLLETLETPLMHMIRNAVDHGLEPPDVRRRAGKPEEGTIQVEAREEAGAFVLRIADDGAGIDFKTLLAKAMASGACPRNRALTPEDVTNLIFLPGVSAAKKVTDISGRGVGMDVVKNQIESAGGKIKVSSKSGKGTEFTIFLPRD